MEGIKGKKTSNLVIKTWEQCKSVGHGQRSSSSGSVSSFFKRSKSWPQMSNASRVSEDQHDLKQAPKRSVALEKGCFSVYVGPDKQRFMIKIEYVNHPLFKALLEEAELEYGFNSGGPLVLPCNVDSFNKVLLVIENGGGGGDNHIPRQSRCGSAKGYGGHSLPSPPRMIAIKQF
ncbi:hypothetical protein SLA2020_340990 [Shorea laevis]